MHYHMEIIIPPYVEDEQSQDKAQYVEGLVAKLLHPLEYSVWDWYVAGGRWASEHTLQQLDKDTLDKFYKKLTKMEVKVSGLQCGKQELIPEDVDRVDELYQKMFKKKGACPLFKHGAKSQYDSDWEYPDVCLVKELPDKFTACKLIIAKRHTEGYPTFLEQSQWTGDDYVDTDWDGTIQAGIEDYNNQNPYDKVTDDWIAVTIDIHN